MPWVVFVCGCVGGYVCVFYLFKIFPKTVRIKPVYTWFIQQFLFSLKQNHSSAVLVIKYILNFACLLNRLDHYFQKCKILALKQSFLKTILPNVQITKRDEILEKRRIPAWHCYCNHFLKNLSTSIMQVSLRISYNGQCQKNQTIAVVL